LVNLESRVLRVLQVGLVVLEQLELMEQPD